MPFLLAEILNFQGSTHHIGVGSFRKIIKTKKKKDKPGSAVMEAVSGLSFFAIFLRL